jgi:hypothetical protein
MAGQDGVPLSYDVIREDDAPDHKIESEPDCNFKQLTIDCAHLIGAVFKIDARKVHHLIHGFVQGKTAEVWVKQSERRQNGQLDLQALQAHCGGKGNKTVRIKEAENLRTPLTCKNERAMSFKKFLTSMQAMFTGFKDNNEVLTDD